MENFRLFGRKVRTLPRKSAEYSTEKCGLCSAAIALKKQLIGFDKYVFKISSYNQDALSARQFPSLPGWGKARIPFKNKQTYTVMKVQKISQLLTPSAGASFVNQEFNEPGFSALIDNHLGMRSLLGHRYSEIFCSWFDIFFRGGEVTGDIQKYLHHTLENIPSNSVPEIQ